MDERRALMWSVLANPDEDTPRLAFADWLDEHGDAHDRARAAFIRFQIDEAKQNKYEGLQLVPLIALTEEWLKPLDPLVGKVITYPPNQIAWSRGLLKYLLFQTGEFLQKAFQKVAPDALAAVGVEHITFYSSTKKAAALASSPAIRWTSSIQYPEADDAVLEAFGASAEWAHLSGLSFTKAKVTDAGLKAFAETAGQLRLRKFGLAAQGGLSNARGKYTVTGLLAVIESDRFPLLDALDLESGQPPKFGYNALFASTALKRFRSLRFSSNVSMNLLAACPNLTNLRELVVNGANISDADMTALLTNPALANLATVCMYGINWGRPRLSKPVDDAFRARFGDGALRYSPESR